MTKFALIMDPKSAVLQIQNVVGVHQMECAIYEPLLHYADKVIFKPHLVLEYVLPFPIVDLVQYTEILTFLPTKQLI